MIARVFAVCDILGGLDVQKLQQRVNFALHREEGFVLAVSAEDQVGAALREDPARRPEDRLLPSS